MVEAENGSVGQVRLLDELSEHVMLRIHSCMNVHHSRDWLEKRVHPDYDVWLVLSGHISIQMLGKSELAKPGDLIFFSPDKPYIASTEGEGCSFIYCHFDFSVGNHSRILDGFKLDGILPGHTAEAEFRLMCEAFHSYKLKAPMSAIRLKGCLTLLLTRILQSYGHRMPADGSTRVLNHPQSGRNLDLLQPVFSFIHNDIHRPISIRELARTAGMSEKYFISFFKKTVGVTPGHYMYQHRMNRARDYLYQKKYSIKEIAGRLGYPDPYSFSKAFKKHYKVPPSKFV